MLLDGIVPSPSQAAAKADLVGGVVPVAQIPTAIPATSIGAGAVSNTEYSYLDGVTSAIQTQLTANAAAIALSKTEELRFLLKDVSGTALSTGVKGDLYVPFACTITGVTVLADQSGSMVIDIWKDTYANYPPTNGDTITASAKPTLSTALKYQDNTLTGWTVAVAAGDTLRFNVDSNATIVSALVSLRVTRA